MCVPSCLVDKEPAYSKRLVPNQNLADDQTIYLIIIGQKPLAVRWLPLDQTR